MLAKIIFYVTKWKLITHVFVKKNAFFLAHLPSLSTTGKPHLQLMKQFGEGNIMLWQRLYEALEALDE